MGTLVFSDPPREMHAQASSVHGRSVVVYEEVFMPYQARAILTRAGSFEPDVVYFAFRRT